MLKDECTLTWKIKILIWKIRLKKCQLLIFFHGNSGAFVVNEIAHQILRFLFHFNLQVPPAIFLLAQVASYAVGHYISGKAASLSCFLSFLIVYPKEIKHLQLLSFSQFVGLCLFLLISIDSILSIRIALIESLIFFFFISTTHF